MTCCVDGCTRSVGNAKRGLCLMHYQRLRRLGTVELRGSTTCSDCGGELPEQTWRGCQRKRCPECALEYRRADWSRRGRSITEARKAERRLVEKACSWCGKAGNQESIPRKYCSPNCCRAATNFRRRNRARTSGHEGERITLDAVVTRDGVACGLCGDLVDLSLRYPDPMSASLDHIVPLSRGGADSLSNVQLAHNRCNLVKGNRSHESRRASEPIRSAP